MSLARHPPPKTLAEFLEWEERQELRYEFDGFAPVAMTGGTRAHETIQMNLAAALVSRLRGGPCRAYGSNLKIEVAGRIRYPDAFVTCGEAGAPGDTVERSPVVVFEVLSDSTQTVDRTDKAREYRETPSVQRYVMLEQVRAAATVYAREGDAWTVSLAFRGDVLSVPEIGVEVPLDELYIGLDLGEASTVEG
jgi:Uma2 family endonuclease